MYCPQCGQQQVSDVTRYCSRCGFLLDGVSAVLATGGTVPVQYVRPAYKQLSPQSKGIRQGALLMLSTVLLVPLVAIIGVAVLDLPGAIVGITAVTCFLGGLLRIFYALLMEESVAPVNLELKAGPATPRFISPSTNAALPPASVSAVPSWRPRPNTAEIYQPPSVTENTTRLLDKDEKRNG
ncbi:MAG: zinc ribbon domain-containing protein [Pyrinomonadaceae bacterium]